MDTSSADRQSSEREKSGLSETGESTFHQPILRFATRLKLPESNRKRKRKAAEPDTPRPKSERELREDAAWKQVEETGKPLVLDQVLLLPEHMSVAEAIQFLPDGIREQTEADWNANMQQVWSFIFESTEERIRKNLAEKGELERYNSFPPYVQHAIIESVVREQWDMPEVPLKELLQQWKNPPEKKEKPDPQKRKRQKKGSRKQLTNEPLPFTDSGHLPSQSGSSTAQFSGKNVAHTSVRIIPARQTTSISPTALDWNKEHHRFLLKRIEQIWLNLDTEEQQAVQEILNHPIGKEEIDRIDEIVKGVEWVRRLRR